ncbi:sigma factor-like helix-turn-helix DNA-binding protein [Neptunicella marina]|uniref:sigma factor-like helix-turn-helix DNA-binding protein n=1 Tax=Neptunicella marina TaxID=2125989 RepID=UPI001F50624A|nr:sigma factor-like helix-turn-helix DNA-binding protein [Neptunicella marina]
MARHTLIDELRKQKNHQHEAIEQLAAPYNQAEDSLLNQFNLALQQLPFEQKEAFVLQQESFSLQQIADITHTEIETVKSRLRYAKNSLSQQLESYHD